MRQRASFWASRFGVWRAAMSAGRMVQLVIIAGVIFVGVNAVAEALHKPILADHYVAPHHFVPAAHTK